MICIGNNRFVIEYCLLEFQFNLISFQQQSINNRIK